MFQKGRSGNPGGRPKGVSHVRELAQKLTGRAFEELERMAFTADDDRVRLEAIKVILDRGYGKAPQPIDGDGTGGPVQVAVCWLPASDAADDQCSLG